ncbi:MAG: hypothetical protein OSA97_08800 [Nevskia sp.]|nr:hypothetical protein [Nevskia sp.]
MAQRRHGLDRGGEAGSPPSALVQEAARILCEEAVLDYRSAKLKAAQRLGLGGNTPLPDNARIQAAVIDYQRLFGGREYAERLRQLRSTAVQAMRLLAEFQPRLSGAAVNGAITAAHRVQLHVFVDKAEALDLFFEHRHIPYRQDDRAYRYANGSEDNVPLLRFEAGAVGIDVAMFGTDDLRRTPLSPSDGLPAKRLTLTEAETLAKVEVDAILGNAAGFTP